MDRNKGPASFAIARDCALNGCSKMDSDIRSDSPISVNTEILRAFMTFSLVMPLMNFYGVVTETLVLGAEKTSSSLMATTV